MNNKKITFIQSTGSWWDHRYYFKQIPAINDSGYHVDYMCRISDKIPQIKNISFISINDSNARKIRLTGGLYLLKKIFSNNYDKIQLCNIELLPLGILLKILTRKKIFYDCREDHFHAMLHGKVWFPNWLRYCLAYGVKILEYLSCKLFDGIIFSDPALYRMHLACKNNKKMIFYNMALNQQFLPKKKISINQLNNKRFDLVVLGSMSIRTGVLDVVQALANLKKSGFKLRLKLIGDPSFDSLLYEKINLIITENDLQNDIIITGRIPYDRIPIELSECKIGIIPLLNIPKFQNNMATKQFEYLSSSVCVIASDLKPQHNFLTHKHNAYFYKAGSVSELVQTISTLLNDNDEIIRLINNGLDCINKNWNAESQQSKYKDFYQKRLINEDYFEKEI